jgi:hypothetical protein
MVFTKNSAKDPMTNKFNGEPSFSDYMKAEDG